MTNWLLLEILVEDHLAGLRILDPEVFRHVAAAEHRVDLRADVVGDPVHGVDRVPIVGDEDGATIRQEQGAPRARPAHRPLTSVATASAGSAVGLAVRGRCTLATALTIAVPTTTPSAEAPITRACSAVLTPKPTQTGRSVWPLMRLTAAATWPCRQRRAGDAGHRDVVDEARRVLQHLRQPLVVGGRRRQPDEVDAGLQRRDAQFLVHLRRQVDDDQPVDAGVDRIGEEAVDAIDVDRVVVAHQHDRRVVVAAAELRGHGQRLRQRLPALQRAQAGCLDRRAVGHRIGERHAELDDVGAGLRQRLHDAAASRRSRDRRP